MTLTGTGGTLSVTDGRPDGDSTDVVAGCDEDIADEALVAAVAEICGIAPADGTLGIAPVEVSEFWRDTSVDGSLGIAPVEVSEFWRATSADGTLGIAPVEVSEIWRVTSADRTLGIAPVEVSGFTLDEDSIGTAAAEIGRIAPDFRGDLGGGRGDLRIRAF